MADRESSGLAGCRGGAVAARSVSQVMTAPAPTRNGRDAAVVISPADLAELEETIAVLSDPDALADSREADAAYANGDVVRGIDAVRRLAR